MEAKVTEIEILTNLLDGENPLKCLCGQITRTRICDAKDIISAIWTGLRMSGPPQNCPKCGRRLTHDTVSPASVEEYKASRK